MHQGLSETEFYGDLVYKFKKIEGMADFSDQFRQIIIRYKHNGYNINIMHAGGSGVRLNDGPDIKLFILVGWGLSFLSVAWTVGNQLLVFFCSSVSVGCSTPQGSPGVGRNTFLSSPHLYFIIVFICDLVYVFSYFPYGF